MVPLNKPRKPSSSSTTVNIKRKTYNSKPVIVEDIKVRRVRRASFVKTRDEAAKLITESVLFLQAFKAGIEVSENQIHSFLDSSDLKLLEDSDRETLDMDISNLLRIFILSYIAKNILKMDDSQSLKYAMDYVAEEKATLMKHNMLKDVAAKSKKQNTDPNFVSMLASLVKQKPEVPFGELKNRKREK